MPELDLIEVLDALDATGVSFELDRSRPTPVLVFEPPLTPEAEALIEPVRLMLSYVAVGRYTGHGPARCDRCGWVSMLATDERTSERARCLDPRCGGRRVIRDADLLVIARTRRGQGARAGARTRRGRMAAEAAGKASAMSNETNEPTETPEQRAEREQRERDEADARRAAERETDDPAS